MIHHVSLPARDPLHVAGILAEMLGGRAFHFPGPLADAAMAVSGDPHGTMIEVYPDTVIMMPGEGSRLHPLSRRVLERTRRAQVLSEVRRRSPRYLLRRPSWHSTT
jgi:hypothetical protein